MSLRSLRLRLPKLAFDIEKQAGLPKRDRNQKHLDAYRNAGTKIRQKFILTHGINRIQLQILATHPDYQRRGFGTALCEWGMKRAKNDDIAVTLIASGPVGFKLYTHLQFRDLGIQIVQAPGEEEKLTVHAMEFIPTKTDAQ